MVSIFLQTLPFFALIGLGYGAVRSGFVRDDEINTLTRFVFYFALPAMLFRFAAGLELEQVLDWTFIGAYLAATFCVYILVTAVAFARRLSVQEAAVEAQCGVVGNVGFLGIPMLAVILGDASVAPIIITVSCDLIVFGSLITILITGSRDGRLSFGIIGTVVRGILANPMIVSIVLGLAWSAASLPLPTPAVDFLSILGAMATPGALFAIGGSLASKSAERFIVPLWLSFSKLILHPTAVAVSMLWVFPVADFPAKVAIAAAALPVAGNVYILAQHYKVAPARVSASILISTAISVVSVSVIIAWLGA